MKLLKVLLIVAMVVMGCKKKSSPLPPDATILVFPNKNSECTVGKDISATTREVDFKWQKANNADSYELRVTNINSNITQTISTPALAAKLPLEKGALFSWLVIAKNDMVVDQVSSQVWLFYNAGSETIYPPFPAEIIAPTIGESVLKDIENEVSLQWLGSDLNNDITGFEIYFDTVSPPVTLLASLSTSATEQKVSVVSNTLYYWKVVTKDADGNSSSSSIFDFRVY